LDGHLGALEEAFRERSKLENFMVPREVVLVDELPHTESGKIRKGSLLV
jgi:acyl-coenzyme A synthetase/AMP-(fatty) acid ligase